MTVDLAENRVRDRRNHGNRAATQYSIEAVLPEVRLSLSHDTVSEASRPVEVAVTATLAGDVRTEDTQVMVTVSGSGLAGVVGFDPVAPFTITIPALASHAAALFTLTPQNDNTAEEDETLTVAGTASGSLAVETATLTLQDDDTASTFVNWRFSPFTIPEGAGPTEVTVTGRLNADASPTDVVFRMLIRPTSRLASIEEYREGSPQPFLTVTIPAGATSGSGAITLTPVQDSLIEAGTEHNLNNRIFIEPSRLRGLADVSPDGPFVADTDLPTSGGHVFLTIVDDDTEGPYAKIRNCGDHTRVSIEFFEQGSEDDLAPVTDFVLADVVTENTGPLVALTGSGADYLLEYERLADFQGEVTVTVPLAAVHDAQGRPNSASSCTQYVDNRRPRVEIRGPDAGAPVSGPFTVRLVFDEPVRGLQLGGLTVGNGTASDLQAVQSSRHPESAAHFSEYVVTITPAGTGTVTVDLGGEPGCGTGGNRRNRAAAPYSIEAVVPEVRLSLSLPMREPVGPLLLRYLGEGRLVAHGPEGICCATTVAAKSAAADGPSVLATAELRPAGVPHTPAQPHLFTAPAVVTKTTARHRMTGWHPFRRAMLAADEAADTFTIEHVFRQLRPLPDDTDRIPTARD